MKLPESVSFKLFEKHGIVHPKFELINQTDRSDEISASFARPPLAKVVVVKADLAIGGKKKAGLVEICQYDQLDKYVKSILNKSTKELPFDSVIVEEFIEHRDEYFVALKAVREGIEVFYSGMGGIEIESNWEIVSKILVPTDLLLRHSGERSDSRIANNVHKGDSGQARMTIEDKFFNIVSEKVIREWIVKLIEFFQEEDATYLEINPFTLVHSSQFTVHSKKNSFTVNSETSSTVNQVAVPLGVVLVVDEAAEFRHHWEQTADSPSRVNGQQTEREKKVAEIDSQIKGSIKLVEAQREGSQFTVHSSQKKNSSSTVNGELSSTVNLTAMMGGGAGAALFLCDAILENGLTLANYAEFSGNPPDFAVAELTKQVCAIPGIKNLVIGSGIANFTPVVGNMKGIIEGFRTSPQAKKLNIVIRRCGPGEDAGIALMKDFIRDSKYNIQVFGRETGMTEIVGYLNN